MGKFADMQAGWKGIAVGMAIACLMLTSLGCGQSVLTSAQAPTPAPATPSPAAAITTIPERRNPVGTFWDAFHTQYQAWQAILDVSVADEAHIDKLEDVMALRQLMQRLQHLFLAVSNLPQGDSTDAWEGTLLGAFEGRGSINGSDHSCTFSCAFSDGSNSSGELEEGKLSAIWKDANETVLGEDGEETQIEGAMRGKAEIFMLDEGYHVSLDWAGGHCALRFSKDTLWFNKDTDAWIEAGAPAEGWAAWHYENGTYIQDAQKPDEEGEPE